jgi:hypothetical protein
MYAWIVTSAAQAAPPILTANPATSAVRGSANPNAPMETPVLHRINVRLPTALMDIVVMGHRGCVVTKVSIAMTAIHAPMIPAHLTINAATQITELPAIRRLATG